MATTIEKLDTFDKLLEKHKFLKFFRIKAWVKKFNCVKTKRSVSL